MSNDMLGNALRSVCGPLGDLNQKLSGQNGEAWLSKLKMFLRQENPWPDSDFRVWTTVEVDLAAKAAYYRKAARQGKFNLDGVANKALAEMTLITAPQATMKFDLVRFRADSPQFKHLGVFKVYEQAKNWGFHLCPHQIAPQLRLDYTDQPMNEILLMAEEGMWVDGRYVYFTVSHNKEGLWLGTETYHMDQRFNNRWGLTPWWVFVREA